MAQLLAAPVLEPLLDDVVEVDAVELSALEVVDDELLVDDAVLLALSVFFAPPELLYRSAYQPPPLRMKPAPPETWRLAEAW